MPLHIPTAFLAMTVASAVLAIALAFVAFLRHRELFLFAAALALNAVTFELFGLRDQVSDTISIVLGNACFSATMALFCEGIFALGRRTPPRWLVWGPVALTAAGFGLLADHDVFRVIFSGLFTMLQVGVALDALWRMRRENAGRGQLILGLGLLVALSIAALRTVAAAAGVTLAMSTASPDVVPIWAFLPGLAALLLVNLGLVILTQERTECRLRESQNQERLRSHVLDLMSAGAALPVVLDEIARGAERLRPGCVCSIAVTDPQDEAAELVVAPSLPPALRALAGRGGPCSDAVRTRGCLLIDDLSKGTTAAPFREGAARAGLSACWCQPVFGSQQALLGNLSLLQRRRCDPAPQDVALLEGLAQLVGLAVERGADVRRLQDSERQYRRLIESASDGICVQQDGVLRYVNPKLRELLGCTETELLGRPLLDLVHPEDRAIAAQNHERRMLGQADDLRYPMRLTTRHRGARWFEMSGVRFEWLGKPATMNILSDVTERRWSEEQVHELAYHDTLTGLPNRRLLMDRLRMAVASNRRSGRYSALVFLDLDNFKPLNDRHGHAVGDLLLIDVARRLQQCVRETDTVARFGGDEFVLLLTELGESEATARDQAAHVADKALLRLAEPYVLTALHQAGNTTVEHRCSASAGVRLFGGLDGDAPDDDELLNQADAAMYRAKQAGCNTVRFHEVPVA